MVKISNKLKKEVVADTENVQKNQRRNKFNKNVKRQAPSLDDLSEQDMNSDDESIDGSDEEEELDGDVKSKTKKNEDEEDEEEDNSEEEEEECEDEEGENEDEFSDEDLTNDFSIKNEDESGNDEESGSDNPSSDDEKNESKKPSRRENLKRRRAQIRASESRTIFVGNVPSGTRRRELRKLFRTFGEIEAVYQRTHLQMTDKLTKMMMCKTPELSEKLKSTNFYVRFAKEEDAEQAVKAMNGTKLNNHVLRVTMGAKREFDCKRTIFIGNLPYTSMDDKVRSHFKQCGKVTGVRLLRDKQTGLTKGFGYVEFFDVNSIPKALELNQVLFEGRKLRVTKAVKKDKLSKIEAKNNNLKRKLTKVPKGAEHFMVLKRGKFDKTQNSAQKIKNKKIQKTGEDDHSDQEVKPNKNLNLKKKKFKNSIIKKRKNKKERKSLII
ncbi:hypothetical protein Mgra_00000267 [Meloidogyne graminicola]|uniref:RRM domain-containing protein n=1 Tax=Meloidogyne graminicola TaxID=189291 RepID=A0A8T0A4X9_9BILA|nr:hypothetical protein Mgra_00000267 [Meloidogyne graminicola]